MKTYFEITSKIDELMDRMNNAIHDDSMTPAELENLCNQIDALLWVIGDNSGKPI